MSLVSRKYQFLDIFDVRVRRLSVLPVLLRVVVLDLFEVVLERSVQDLALVRQLVDVLDEVVQELAVDFHHLRVQTTDKQQEERVWAVVVLELCLWVSPGLLLEADLAEGARIRYL